MQETKNQFTFKNSCCVSFAPLLPNRTAVYNIDSKLWYATANVCFYIKALFNNFKLSINRPQYQELEQKYIGSFSATYVACCSVVHRMKSCYVVI